MYVDPFKTHIDPTKWHILFEGVNSFEPMPNTIHPALKQNQTAKPDCQPLPRGKEPAASADTGCIMILSCGEMCNLFLGTFWTGMMTNARLKVLILVG